MRYTFIIVVLLFIHFAFAQEKITSEYYKNTLDQLFNWQVSQDNMYRVDSLILQKDAGTFLLNDGDIFLLPPINDRHIAALFLGNGLFLMTPPTRIEQDNLYRFIKSKTVAQKFDMLIMIFADTTFTDTFKRLPLSTGDKQEGTANRFLNYVTREYLGDDDSYYFQPEILKFLLNEHNNSFFYSHFRKGLSDDGVNFKISPYNWEEVTLSRNNDIISMFHLQDEYKNGNIPETSDTDELKVLHQNLNCTIEDNMYFTASAESNLSFLTPLKWFKLLLYGGTEIDSIKWTDGSEAEYYKGEDNSFVWIKVPQQYSEAGKASLTLYYKSDELLERFDNWISIRSYHYWRPVYGGRNQYTTYDINFKTPEGFQFICVGKKEMYDEQDDYTFSHWVVDKPVRNISFNLGLFNVYEMDNPKLQNSISVLISQSGHRGPEIAFQFGSGSDMEEQVGADVINSMTLFEHVYGPIDMPHFYITEYPRFWSGEAFPGLINLGWKTFQSTDAYGLDEVLRAHEVAHQWWGINVDFESYHDQWLSEGLSEFSGLWYLHLSSEDKSKYMDIIEKSRELILNNRKYLLGDGQEAAPIWLGYRTSSSETAGDYNLIVYQKSAWVFQMLRVMMLNLKTMNEDPFTNMMRDVFQTFKGKRITTELFRKIVEKHFGMSMEWFFDQWIYNTHIPKYLYSYSTKKQSDGKYIVQLKVKQENVPENFKMYVPIKIDFGDDRFARLRVPVDKLSNLIKLPPVPLEPEEIIFNDLNGVLAEVEEVDWDDI